jgi:hypothetical protein
MCRAKSLAVGSRNSVHNSLYSFVDFAHNHLKRNLSASNGSEIGLFL